MPCYQHGQVAIGASVKLRKAKQVDRCTYRLGFKLPTLFVMDDRYQPIGVIPGRNSNDS